MGKDKTVITEYIHKGTVFISGMILYYVIARIVIKITGIQGTSRAGLNISIIWKNIRFYVLNQHKYIRWTTYVDGEYITGGFIAFFALWAIVLWISYHKEHHGRKVIQCVVISLMTYGAMYILPVISAVHSYRAATGIFGIYLIGTMGIVLHAINNQRIMKICAPKPMENHC